MKLIIITAKPCMCQRKPNAGWTSWYGKSVSREQAFRDMWNRYCENTSIKTRMMWKGGGNSEQLHSSNANPCELPHSQNAVTQQGLINLFLDIGKVCLCTTNYHLSHKDFCPEGGIKSLRSRD